MASSDRVRVMLSSRCNDRFPFDDPHGRTLTDLRLELKDEIESLQLFGKKIFEVWINEETPPKGGELDSWEVCLDAVKSCDILIVLSNGNAGWAKTRGDIGICHAELMTGLDRSPGKVRLISLGNIPCDTSDQGTRNKNFQDYLTLLNLFGGAEAKKVEELKSRVKDAILDAVVTLVHLGVRECSMGRLHSGQALGWNRLDFARRGEQMQKVLREAILQRRDSKLDGDVLLARLDHTEVLLVTHAIPAALSVPAAREMVGQPFLKDYMLAGELKGKRSGPVHLIACHRTATESQATKVLGCPDAEVVSAPFGIYVADNIRKVQFAFIVNCRDETTTRHGVQRFFEWLAQTGEDSLLARRAKSRAKIVKAIADEAIRS